ncbi:MAG: sugar phosphate isomerase/epimerase family protein [Isosphaeraceae bacterium]|nr:sugar phosphate isomerase/epimerase family protein [Isosphaeraceae bacterium]
MTRRDLLRAMTLPVLASTAHAIEPIARKHAGHLKLSLAAYSFRDALQAEKGDKRDFDLFDFVDLAASYSVDAVELTSYYFPTEISPDYLNKLQQYAFRQGLDVSGTSVGNNFCVAPGPERDRQIELVKTWIDRAAILHAPVIRIFAGSVPKGETEAAAVARTLECLAIVLPYAEKHGISLALENHGGITATARQLLTLVKAVDSPNFGVNLDTGNFHSADPYAELAAIAPYALNVQVKTEIAPKGKTKGPADLSKIVAILREARYSGHVVLEYEAKEDPFKAVPHHLKTLRSLLG